LGLSSFAKATEDKNWVCFWLPIKLCVFISHCYKVTYILSMAVEIGFVLHTLVNWLNGVSYS
jgi:hypothetical protein